MRLNIQFVLIISIIIIIIIIFMINSKKELFTNDNIINNEALTYFMKLCDNKEKAYFSTLNTSSNFTIENKKINQYIYDTIYPIGSFYVQYPDTLTSNKNTEFSLKKNPNTLFSGTKWVAQWNTESIFFRTEGVLSAENRTNGLQDYAIRNIKSTMSYVQADNGGQRDFANVGNPGEGVFGGKQNTLLIHSDGGWGWDKGHKLIFDTQFVLPNNTSETETRVKNRRMIIWKRTA